MRTQILTADDSSVMLLLTSAIIEALGYEPIKAQDGEQAVRLSVAHHDKLALILLDWNMPKKDGLQALIEIKQDSRLREIPVVMVTTESEGKSVVRAVQAGASHYVTKPFTQEELAIAIKEALGLGDDGGEGAAT